MSCGSMDLAMKAITEAEQLFKEGDIAGAITKNEEAASLVFGLLSEADCMYNIQLHKIKFLKTLLKESVGTQDNVCMDLPTIDSTLGVNQWDAHEKLAISAIDKQPTEVSWGDLHGMDKAKETLESTLLLVLEYGDTPIAQSDFPTIMLVGAAGVGKTTLIKAAMARFNKGITLFNVSPEFIMSKFIGDSTKNVAALFRVAKKYAPSIIFLDEIEALGGSRDSKQNEESLHAKNTLLCRVSEMRSSDGVILIGSTNLPDNVDNALFSRFQSKIYVPLPSQEVRRMLFEVYLGRCNFTTKEDDLNKTGINEAGLKKLAAATTNYSGRDIRVAVKKAENKKFISEAIQRSPSSRAYEDVRKSIQPFTLDEVMNAIKETPSQNKDDVSKLQKWYVDNCNGCTSYSFEEVEDDMARDLWSCIVENCGWFALFDCVFKKQ